MIFQENRTYAFDTIHSILEETVQSLKEYNSWTKELYKLMPDDLIRERIKETENIEFEVNSSLSKLKEYKISLIKTGCEPTDKDAVIQNIAAAFSLSDKAARTACLLLESRAKILDFTFHQYMQRYHPDGFAPKKNDIQEPFQGYEAHLKEDSLILMSMLKQEDGVQFMQYCAHIFFKQLTGELRSVAERSFNITDAKWQNENIVSFLEQDAGNGGFYDSKSLLYAKWDIFLNNVTQGMEIINA